MKSIDNEKFASFIKLLLWIIFIVFLLLIINFGGKNKNNDIKIEDDNVKEISYEEKLDKLNDKYEYSYEIKINGEIYEFIGYKEENKEQGSYVFNNEKVFYYINDENSKFYKIIDGVEQSVDNIFEKIDVNNLDVVKIKESISNKEYIKDGNKYSYLLENNKIVSIYTDSENIIKIEIFIGEDYYKLEYSNIGLTIYLSAD